MTSDLPRGIALALIALVQACQPAASPQAIAKLADIATCLPNVPSGTPELSNCVDPSPLQSLSRSHWGAPTSSCTYRRDEHADVVTCIYPDQLSGSEGSQ